MISDEEKELIATREKWADFPIINFWHNTKRVDSELQNQHMLHPNQEALH